MPNLDATQVLDQLRSMPNITAENRAQLDYLFQVLNSEGEHTPNEVRLAKASVFVLERVLEGDFEQLGELRFHEDSARLAANVSGYYTQRSEVVRTLRRVITGLSVKDAVALATALMSERTYPIYSPRVEVELCVADEALSKVHVSYVTFGDFDIDV